jgi:hypothetical protein
MLTGIGPLECFATPFCSESVGWSAASVDPAGHEGPLFDDPGSPGLGGEGAWVICNITDSHSLVLKCRGE